MSNPTAILQIIIYYIKPTSTRLSNISMFVQDFLLSLESANVSEPVLMYFATEQFLFSK